MAMGSGLKKQFSKPPLPLKKSKPKVVIVKVTKPLSQRSDGLFSMEIDHAYAEISSTYIDAGYDRAKPKWFSAPDTDECAVWFAQNSYNTVIIHKEVKYALMDVKQGARKEVPCTNQYCKKWLVDTGSPCEGHRGGSPGTVRVFDKLWVLKPVTLPPESEEWVNKHLAEVL
jgi:hypothetical protein